MRAHVWALIRSDMSSKFGTTTSLAESSIFKTIPTDNRNKLSFYRKPAIFEPPSFFGLQTAS